MNLSKSFYRFYFVKLYLLTTIFLMLYIILKNLSPMYHRHKNYLKNFSPVSVQKLFICEFRKVIDEGMIDI